MSKLDHDAGFLALDPMRLADDEMTRVEQLEADNDILAKENVALRKVLAAWQIRLAFVGHPNEPRDWSKPVQLTDAALSSLSPEVARVEKAVALVEWMESHDGYWTIYREDGVALFTVYRAACKKEKDNG